MDATYFQEFGPRLVDVSSASGYMGATYFQEFGLGTWVQHMFSDVFEN